MRIKTFGYLMAGHTLGALAPARSARFDGPRGGDWKSRWECKAGEVLLQHICEQGGKITLDRPPRYLVSLLGRLEAQRKIERIQAEGLIERVANASVFTYHLA